MVDVDRWLIDAGLKAGGQIDDVVVVSNGPSALLYVRDASRRGSESWSSSCRAAIRSA
jgi:hypothetical protein